LLVIACRNQPRERIVASHWDPRIFARRAETHRICAALRSAGFEIRLTSVTLQSLVSMFRQRHPA